MLNKNVEVFMACEKEAHEADIVLFGAPFDSTTSYRPGTRFGSSAIRRESYGIECYSPYQDKEGDGLWRSGALLWKYKKGACAD